MDRERAKSRKMVWHPLIMPWSLSSFGTYKRQSQASESHHSFTRLHVVFVSIHNLAAKDDQHEMETQ